MMPTGVLKFDKHGRAWIYAFGVWFMTPLVDGASRNAKSTEGEGGE